MGNPEHVRTAPRKPMGIIEIFSAHADLRSGLYSHLGFECDTKTE